MSQSASSPLPHTGSAPVLIGVDDVLERLAELYRQTRRGTVTAAVLHGASGTGKTAVLSEFLAQLRSGSRPPKVLRAQGDRWESSLQLAGYSQLMMTSPVRSGKGYDVDLPQTAVSTQPLSADRIVNHAATLGTHVEALAARTPVVLVIDDAHWLDEASLRVLSFVIRRIHAHKVMFVLTMDREYAVAMPAGLLDQLTGHEIHQLELEPLSARAAQRLARRRFNIDLPSAAAHELVRHTRGNPQQMCELLAELPPETWQSWFPSLPASRRVRARVAAVLSSASPELVAVAQAAALLGDQASFAEVAAVCGIPDQDALVRALDEGHESGLLRLELGQVSSRVRFVDASAAGAVYERMTPSRRIDLHQRASRAVSDEGRRLEHLVRSSPAADGDLACALDRFASRQAAQGNWYDAASALLSASRLCRHERERNHFLVRAVDAMIASGNVSEAKAWLGAVDDMPASALRSSVYGYLAVVTGQSRTAHTQLTSAWRTVNRTQDPDTAAQIAQRHVLAGVGAWDGPAMIEWAERAMSLTDPTSASFIETEAIYGLGLYATGQLERAHAAYAKAFEHCSETAQKQRVEMGAGWLALRTDDVETARTRLEFSGPAKFRGGSLRISLWAEAWLARTHLVLGNWDAAAATISRASGRLETSGMTLMRPLLYWTAAELYAMRGDWSLARHYVGLAAAPTDSFLCMTVPSLLAKARFHEARGDYQGAYECMARVAELDPWTPQRISFWPWQDTYVNAMVMTGRVEQAHAFLEEFEAVPRHQHIPSDQARLKWSRGRVLAAQGDAETAKEYFEYALNEVRTLNRPYLRARMSFAFGQSMRRAGKRRLASSVLRAARDLYEMLGAHTYVQRCDRELKATGVEIGTGPDPADPVLAAVQRERVQLTPQEGAVAELVAGGATNKEVASHLFIAEKTVQYHLTRIYTKYGIRSRSELAARYRDGG